MVKISLMVNKKIESVEVMFNTLLSTLLREHLNLTGTHIGCDTSQCGACVVIVDGKTVKSCTILAVQAANTQIQTVEGLSGDDKLHPMQEAFREYHALQCGFCTPGMLMTAIALVQKNRDLNEDIIREGLEGNLCRCTGYQNIVAAILAGAEEMRGQG